MNKKSTKHDLYLTFLANLQTEKPKAVPQPKVRTPRKSMMTQAQQFVYNVAAKAKRMAFA